MGPDEQRDVIGPGENRRRMVGAVHPQAHSEGRHLQDYQEDRARDQEDDKLDRDPRDVAIPDGCEGRRESRQRTAAGDAQADPGGHHLHAQRHQHGRYPEDSDDHAVEESDHQADRDADHKRADHDGNIFLPFGNVPVHEQPHQDRGQIGGRDDGQIDPAHQHRQHHRQREQPDLRDLPGDGRK